MRRGTYSIVARDPASGDLGVGVQSHWFSVGSVVPWARPGAGALALQSVTDTAQAPRALEALAAGARGADVLSSLLEGDETAAYRQTAVVDARGDAAAHTGERCIAEAGHVTGDGWSCQANLMSRPGVPEAMGDAFVAAEGDLATRLLAALRAAEEAGGDVRGRQSAALIVVPAEGAPHVRAVDLRVEDHADPVGELRRLLVLHRAYALAGEADELLAAGRHDDAGERYEEAARLAPHHDELLFWAGLAQAHAGDLQAGVARVRRAIALNRRWEQVLPRLAADVAPAAEAVSAELGRAGQRGERG